MILSVVKAELAESLGGFRFHASLWVLKRLVQPSLCGNPQCGRYFKTSKVSVVGRSAWEEWSPFLPHLCGGQPRVTMVPEEAGTVNGRTMWEMVSGRQVLGDVLHSNQ